MTKTADLFIKALENEGVEVIFGLPGEENIDFLEALRDSNIRFIVTRHEQSAGFMAATYGQLTGKPGVVLATLGPGATNLITAAAYAQLGGKPMLMITGQKPIQENEQISFQIVDVVGMMIPVTKFSKRISFGSQVPAIVREAFRIAVRERPGAVHIELPEDVARKKVDTEPFQVIPDHFPQASESVIKEAITMIRSAKKPLVLIGASANRKDLYDLLSDFIEHNSFYFFNTQLGKGVINEQSSYYLGTAALSKDDFIHDAVKQADLIINIGHDVAEKPPFLMKEDAQRVIHISYQPAVIDEVYYPHLSVIGDIAAAINQINSKLENTVSDKESRSYLEEQRHISQTLNRYNRDDRFPILPQRLCSIIREELAPDDIVTLDNGMYKLWFARLYKTYEPNTLLLDNSLASMGAGLPSAIAAKLIYPKQRVISVNGDGGFLMNSQELETAKRLGLDLTVIVVRDDAYGMVRWKQESMGLDDFGLSYDNPDFVKYAESYGAQGYRPNTVTAFQKTLQQSLHKPGIHLIDLAIDYSFNQRLAEDV
ncbi:acetolactate synthase large subunit [Olivibacter sp. SDN3]|uniref:acetolactate synthase large subunit n=1 Tax=Olivibacter sp. SDN3 TaxID=2764720 RepID=UPI001650E3AE|nr:acetolactate synthase large subunit [Olivibacter sp. SDN3]QNL50168.1 acetolactate synthase large subunit [Olivibacter sp. SDN3]